MTEERGNIRLKCCVASNEGQDPPYIYIYGDFVCLVIRIGFDDK